MFAVGRLLSRLHIRCFVPFIVCVSGSVGSLRWLLVVVLTSCMGRHLSLALLEQQFQLSASCFSLVKVLACERRSLRRLFEDAGLPGPHAEIANTIFVDYAFRLASLALVARLLGHASFRVTIHWHDRGRPFRWDMIAENLESDDHQRW